MSLIIRLHNISFNNPYTISYKSGEVLGSLNDLIELNTTFSGSTVSLNEDFEFNTKYWFKLTDTVTDQFIIKSFTTNESKIYECYDEIDIDVVITQSGDTYTITINDNVLPNGNNSSIIDNIPKSYYIYTGLTLNEIFNTNITPIGEGTTDISGEIYSFTTTNTNSFYLFVTHGDGVNVDNKRQGGFSVKSINFR